MPIALINIDGVTSVFINKLEGEELFRPKIK